MLFPVKPKQTHAMQTRDGMRLDADVYVPDAAGEFPVLLMRQPYGRAIASTVVYAHPTWYAAHGYIVVIQDVRGRGTSEGEFRLFAHEVDDGEDTVNWAASLPGSNGMVGMYGFSYQGMTQLYAAMRQPAALKALAPGMVGYDLYHDWAYEGGAFCLQASLGWAIQLAAETARLKGDSVAYEQLFKASSNLPLTDPVIARPQVLKDYAPDSFYHDWLNHSDPDDDYWRKLTPDLTGVDLPMLHIGGWFDAYLRGTIHLYKDMAATCQSRQQLWVGPWNHIPWGRKVGAVDFGTEANNTVDTLQIRWFDHFLKGIDTGLLDEPPVSLFEMGTNQWHSFEAWPSGTAQTWYLTSDGLASMCDRSGKLQPNPSDISQPDVFVHDPWRPVPAVGGHSSFPAGMFDRSSVDCRSDVLTYTTDWLEEPVAIAGDLTVELYCTADVPSFDLCAVLSEVYPDGRVYNLSQGYLHIPVAQSQLQPELRHIQLHPICARIPAGHALRLSVSASCFPTHPVNPGTGENPTQARQMDARIVAITLKSSARVASKLVLGHFEK
ncbi:MAG: CocE/NonD family hydrolase [Thainema sp.]